MSQNKKRIAVFFGGRSPEHDVSVVSGLQALGALDQTRFEVFPVYITPDGVLLTGDVLRKRSNYMLDGDARKQTVQVTLDVTAAKPGRLIPVKSGLFGGGKAIEFDVALPAFHGLSGENGDIQGLFEVANIPYASTRVMSSSIFMDKKATKYVLEALGVPYLPYAILKRPDEGYLIPKDELENLVKDIEFPCIVKPSHLGSSIGVAKAGNIDELSACLPAIFEYDDEAIVEPFVKNLVEYNVAVSKAFGGLRTSAIERPKGTEELLDFKQKYMSGGDNKIGGGTKDVGTISEGMLSLTRELNPPLDKKSEENIRNWSGKVFEALNGTGAPRIDFIGDSKSGEIWFNEVNPIPGSFGYFLWEAAADPILFTDFLSGLIDEALLENAKRSLPKDPVPRDARLHRRKG